MRVAVRRPVQEGIHAIDYERFLDDEPRRVHGACRRPGARGGRGRQFGGRCRHGLSRWRQRHAGHLARFAGRRQFAVLKDFPLTLDPSSLRVEGEAGAKLTIGAIDAKPPRAAPPVNLPELDKRIEALKDERVNLQGAIDAATARRKFAERFADTSPAGIGDKGEARPIAEWRAAFAAVGEEVASADAAIRDAERKQRELDREIARLEQDRAQKPPSKLEVRIELAAAAATKATLRVTYAVRNARWTPLYDARLDTGAKDRKPALELVRRAEITQNTGEDWSNVALAVSTVRTARGGSAPDLKSLVVQYPQVPRPMSAGLVSDFAMPSAAPPPDRLRQFRATGGRARRP